MAEQRSQHRRKKDTTTEQAVVEAVLGGIWGLIKLPFSRGKQKAHGLSQAVALELSQHWGGIEHFLNNPATYSLAVTEGDKILDATLQASAVEGKNMSERLQKAQPRFESALYQEIWDAHKLRNQIAHEVGTVITYEQAQDATATFRHALRTLGVPL